MGSGPGLFVRSEIKVEKTTFRAWRQSMGSEKKWISCLGLAVAGVASAWAHSAQAAVFTLEDGNSTADFDTTDGFNSGQQSWVIDGTNHLNLQAFFFRVGDTGEEVNLGTLPIAGGGSDVSATDTNLSGKDDTLFVRYDSGSFLVEVKWSLQGGSPGSGTADIAEQIKIINTTGSALDMHFFQYVDFNLGGSSAGDTVRIDNERTAVQFNGGFVGSETVVTPMPARYEAGSAGLGGIFSNGVADDLANASGPLSPADAAWGFQWDVVIAPNDSFLISKDKQITQIPEPTSLALLGLGGLLLTRRRR